ncbi:hypothetical protein BOTBODRAFT_146503 [Botryobasidium botryosum FD-172 SS1]|uniref:Enoyl reductase (ER) domain-containing protein n=1 Tax=Botryobasidium botryosum (strain FD-172 SS1) TaxID=930990 RepID=A0A067MA98_BOTB1|nr:hypothetical protein BOTBODRAFT_146503 [Botryobasidium botryosum FD-172 SS1]
MSQTALIYPSNTAPFEIGTRPIPSPEDDQLLVKVMSAALNPCDSLAQQGLIPFLKVFPAVLGIDVAGIVEKTGSKVSGFSAGDKVFFQGYMFDSNQTGYQQYTVVPSDIVSHIPSNLSFDQAASVPLAFVTAFVGLFHSTGMRIAPPFSGPTVTAEDSTILIIGGSSVVGFFAIQLARMAGFKRILTTVAPKHNDTVKVVGATHVFDRAAADLEDQIGAVTGGDLVYVYDAISSQDTQNLGWRLLSDTKPGILAVVHDAAQTEASPKKPQESKWLYIYGSGHWYRDLSIPAWKAIGKWLEEGVLVPPKTTVIGGLAAVPEGIQRLKEGKISGEKLIVHPWE